MQSQVSIKYVLLKDLVSFKMGTIIKKLSILRQEGKLSNGQYDIISSAIKPIGKWNEFNTDGNTITITKDGDCGNVAWQAQPFWATEHSITLINNVPSTINSKYLFYYLKAIENQIKELKIQSAPDFLRIDDLKQIEVPVPNLETQKQIAATLDKFNQLTNQLTNQLNLRTKQYQYYLEHLMDFTNDNHPLIKDGGGGVIRKIPLGEIVEFGRGQIIKKMTKLIENHQLPPGPYPIISSATTALAMYDQCNNNANQVVVSSHGVNSGFVSYQEQPFWATPLRHILNTKDPQILNNKFLYYALIAQQNQLNDLKAGGAIPFISQSDLKTIEINLPDLSIQKQIVAALDQLNTLVNDAKQGLPKAIINTNKQCRYYLNLLMTFNLS